MADSHIEPLIAVSYNESTKELQSGVEKMVDYRALFKRRRQEKGLTQTQLGELVDRTQAYIYEIESGRKTPSLDLFFQICEALDIQVFPEEQ